MEATPNSRGDMAPHILPIETPLAGSPDSPECYSFVLKSNVSFRRLAIRSCVFFATMYW